MTFLGLLRVDVAVAVVATDGGVTTGTGTTGTKEADGDV